MCVCVRGGKICEKVMSERGKGHNETNDVEWEDGVTW